MATTMIRQRPATPARWQAALGRAIAEGVQVRQLAGSGLWLATSSTDAGTAFALAVTGDVAHGCECPAAAHGDPVCKHRAAFYHTVGVLDPDPGPGAPAAPVALPCWSCRGTGTEQVEGTNGRWFLVACEACNGAGSIADDGDDGDDLVESAPDDHTRRAAVARPALASVVCGGCDGRGWHAHVSVTFPGVTYRTTCQTCGGSGAPALALRPAA